MNKSHLVCIIIISLASFSNCQDLIGCYIQGDCHGGPLVGFSTEQDSVACHVLCDDTASCDYWTFYTDDGTCLLYSETCDVGTEPGTISGEVRGYISIFQQFCIHEY